MQMAHRAMWKSMKYRSGIFRLIGSHANTTQSHVKTCEMSLSNLQTYWKPCKYHTGPRENTWKIAQESSDLLDAMQIPCLALWKHKKYHRESSDLLKAMQTPRKAKWKHVKYHTNTTQSHVKILKYCSGTFRLIGSHANTTQSHVKTHVNHDSAW